MNWNQANKFIKKLNKKRYGGYADWRLPTVNELHSLIDYTQYNPVLPHGHPFINVKPYRYWSATTYAYHTDYVWAVYMNYGYVHGFNKSGNFYAWPVRSGQCESLRNPPTRFLDNGNGTVIDSRTGLMWTKDANIQP